MASIARLAAVTAIMSTACATGFVVQSNAALFMKAADKYAILENCVAEAHAANPNADAARYATYAACMKKNHLKSPPE